MKRILMLVTLFSISASYADDKKTAPDPKSTTTDDPSIRLESTFVGDKEQPSVSYFIPWKGNGTPDKLQWNMEEKYDQALQVIDRDVLLNSMHIYNAMDLETSGAAAE